MRPPSPKQLVQHDSITIRWVKSPVILLHLIQGYIGTGPTFFPSSLNHASCFALPYAPPMGITYRVTPFQSSMTRTHKTISRKRNGPDLPRACSYTDTGLRASEVTGGRYDPSFGVPVGRLLSSTAEKE
jgi:hypothetical protein